LNRVGVANEMYPAVPSEMYPAVVSEMYPAVASEMYPGERGRHKKITKNIKRGGEPIL